MKYYQALKDSYDYFSKNAIVRGELLTERERNKKVPYIADSYFRIIDLSRKNIFVSFGVRFPIHESEYYLPLN